MANGTVRRTGEGVLIRPLGVVAVAAVLGTAALTRGGGAGPDSQAEPTPPRFAARADVVTVDVVALDDAGEPVEGLTAADFVLRDEGREREISRFEAVVIPESAPEPTGWPTPVSTNVTDAARAARTFAIVFDDAHMAPDTALGAKRAVREFLDVGLGAGDHVLLAAVSGGAWWNATLPEGRDDLVAALERLQGLRPRVTTTDRISDYEAMRLHLYRDLKVGAQVTRRYYEHRHILEPPNTEAGYRQQFDIGDTHPLVRARAAEVYRALADRRLATCRALERVAHALEGRRGRKSILWISEGFIQEPDRPEHTDAVRAAARANAAVHFLDARGLVGIPATADAEVPDPTDLRDMGAQLNEATFEALGAVSIAADTGGRVVKNTNDLSRGLRRIARESRAYYLLGFEPTDVARDGSFHRLAVRVSRPGVKVLARRGYFAPASEGAQPEPPPSGLDPVLRAAVDSPFDADGIPLRLASYVESPPGEQQTVLFVADVDPAALALEAHEGVSAGQLGTWLLVSGRDTGETFHREREVELRLPPAARERYQRTWIPLARELLLPPGTYQARLLVRDLRSGRVGTVGHVLEVPRPGQFGISTPILTDSLEPGRDGAARPVPLARRTFARGNTLALAFDVRGAAAGPGESPRVACGYRVETRGGAVIATQPDGEIPPGPDGRLSPLFTLSLAGVAPGDYAIVVHARDERSGEAVVAREPFRVNAPGEPAAATASGESTERRVPDPERDRILEQAGGYAVEFEEGFSNIVAEETYTQWASSVSTLGPRAQRRVTRADLVFVRLAGDIPWGSYRDVFEADGRPVREREARLEKLFLEGATPVSERARAILAQSAAYNIGMARTANVPTLPLLFLLPRQQPRFVFERGDEKQISETTTVELRFREVARPTIVRGDGGDDLPASGRFYIDPARGTVVRTELRFESPEVALATITTDYQPVPALAMWLPSRMSERYQELPGARPPVDIPDRRYSTAPRVQHTIEAVATYSNFRRFGVSVEEEAHLPPDEEPW